jgi:hypothetical protein
MPKSCPACSYEANDDAQARIACPCCGFEPASGGDAAEWRRHWKACGMPWSSMMVPQPQNWDPTRQLDDPTKDEER